MRIVYTKHSKNKFGLLKTHGFRITKEQVKEAILNPESVTLSIKGRFIAQRRLNETHVIRVIYSKEKDIIKVITFYPARRERYEG
ncbi:MAG: hypothetical protein QXM25_03020 [Nitrososphaerales archaeon]